MLSPYGPNPLILTRFAPEPRRNTPKHRPTARTKEAQSQLTFVCSSVLSDWVPEEKYPIHPKTTQKRKCPPVFAEKWPTLVKMALLHLF